MSNMAALIRGVVRSIEGSPIVQARAYFVGAPAAVPDIAALTNERGEFTLSAPAAGTYRVECAAEGFSGKTVTVDAPRDGESRIEVRLTPSA
jgi:hypothetical protein